MELYRSHNNIVIDPNSRTAKDKRTGYDLLNPKIPTRLWAPKRVVPLPTPPKTLRPMVTTLESVSELALAGYLLPAPIMAAVHERIEIIFFQEQLTKKDAEMKQRFRDHFPLWLPDTTNNVPDHIYHWIQLKDPNKTMKGHGYSVPKKIP